MKYYLFENIKDIYSDLVNYIRNENSECCIVSLEESETLITGIITPATFFLYNNEHLNWEANPMYFNKLNIPILWECMFKKVPYEIYEFDTKKANLYFYDPFEKKMVRKIEWFNKSGLNIKNDYYNQYGLLYKTEYLKQNGLVATIAYHKNCEDVIVEQLGNKTISLFENNKIKKIFSSKTDYINYFINSLVKENDELCCISKNDLNKVRQYNSNVKYEVVKPLSDNIEKEIFILTASDQIQHLANIVDALPDFHFVIGARTAVSDSLASFGNRSNVDVHPGIGPDTIIRLLSKTSFYLDINHYNEESDIINLSLQYNKIILGFNNTLHHPDYVSSANIFNEQDYLALTDRIKYLASDINNYNSSLQEQISIQLS